MIALQVAPAGSAFREQIQYGPTQRSTKIFGHDDLRWDANGH